MRSLAILTAILMAAAFFAAGQVITGTILGTVTDPAGAVVPGARIVIVNTGTNVRTETRSSTSGEFVAPYLPAGTYDVSVESGGFRAFRQTAIRLTIDAKYRIDARLTVGAVTESVEVVSNVQVLQTDSSDLNTTISSVAIQNLPNIGRNPMNYMVTVAGVVPRTNFEAVNNFAVGDDSRGRFSNFTVNGSRPISSEILLDGAPNTSGAFNEIAVLPSLDAIGELKVITNAYSAEYGRAGGGVVSFTTKSGTNNWHGSLYEYLRNPVLNANSFGNNSFGTGLDGKPVRPKGKFNINQFGGSLSGPVRLPKIYDGRNKTFFLFSYEGIRHAEDASAFLTMPTELERRGDFSQSRALVRNPATGLNVLVPRNIYAPFHSTTEIIPVGTNFRLVRQQFQDGGILNRIPQSQINPTAQRFMNFYPLPNITPLQPDGTQNYFDGNSNYNRTDQIIGRLDHNFSQQNRTFFRWTTDWTLSTPRNRFRTTNPEATDAAPVSQFNPTATIGHTWSLSPTTLFEFRGNVTRINLIQQPASGLNADMEGLGFSREMLAVIPSYAFPRIAPGSGYQQIGIGNFVLRDNHSTNYSFNANLTKILNKWTVKFGGEYRPLFNNFYQPYVPSMAFVPLNFTQRCAGAGCPTLTYDDSQGHVLADFLLGNFNGAVSGQYSTGDPRMALKNAYWGFFSQNDFKATRNLTINLGLRWDYQGPLTERYNRLSQFDRTAKNITGTPGAYVFSGVGGNSRGQMDSDFRNWGPRVGFAYRLFDKSVIRSAYGISYDQITGVGSGAAGFGVDGFTYPAFMRTRPVSGLDILDRPFNDAFSGGGVIVGPNPSSPDLLGIFAYAVDRRQRTPYVQQWNFTIEREVGAGFHATAAYVGTKGTRLSVQSVPMNGDNSVPESLLRSSRDELIRTGVNPLTGFVPNPMYGIIPSSNATLGSPTITLLNLNRAFPAYSNSTVALQQRFGSSNYHALQLSARRAFSKGVEVGANYTWSKNIDFSNSIQVNAINAQNGGGNSSFTLNNFALERSVANSDIPHRAVVHYVVELPFGKGKPLLTSTPVLSQVAGGWKLAGIASFSAGLPLTITGGGFGRPDLISDPFLPKEYRCFGDGVTPCKLPDGSSVVVPNRRMLYFNPKAFRNRTIQTPTQILNDVYWYGTSPRFLSRLRTPGVNNWNMTVSRDFAFGENGPRLEFRAEAVNVFNRTEFGPGGINRDLGSANLNPANGPLGQSTSATFGTLDINNLGRTPRYMQLSLRIMF
jgi:trimeric autotransporter adhesin